MCILKLLLFFPQKYTNLHFEFSFLDVGGPQFQIGDLKKQTYPNVKLRAGFLVRI